MEFITSTMTTIQLTVPTPEAFTAMIELKELPEATLEITETREIIDDYLDTSDFALVKHGSALRLSMVGSHHFLIYNAKKHPATLLAYESEQVERLSPSEFDAQRSGDRNHELYSEIATQTPGELQSSIVRRSTLQSRLFRVGETRFELALEAIVYEADGRQAGEQLVTLELIEGSFDILSAMATYLSEEFGLQPVVDAPYHRGLAVLNVHSS